MKYKQIPVIVIDGGPCGGKSTICNILIQKLAQMGWTLILLEEAASEFGRSGLKPDLFNDGDFQTQLMEYIIEKEDRWIKAAKLIKSKKKVIICDRGSMTGKAYIRPDLFSGILDAQGYNIVNLRDARYNAVIFLRSVAVDAPHLYTCENNPQRNEKTPEEARALDERTLEAWTGHPHLRIIDNSTDLEGKARRVFEEVCRVLGEPIPLEIEKKYLVHKCDLSQLPKPVQKISIRQNYLVSKESGKVERVRDRSQDGCSIYFYTSKQNVSSGVRTETERRITEEEYAEYLTRVDPSKHTIIKDRYCFVWKNQYFELDVIKSPMEIMLLEIELTHETQEVILPSFLKDHLKDVTGDLEYNNHSIASNTITSK